MRLLTLEPPQHVLKRPGTWDDVQRNLAYTFPPDYVELVDTYGSGVIGGFLWLFSPFARNNNINVLNVLENERTRFARIRELGNENLPYTIHPDQNGLVPVMGTENGDRIYLKPGGCSIVVIPFRSDEYEEFDLVIVDFIAGILEGAIKAKTFPADFPGEDVFFEHY